ncbi:MAG: Asp23/Gls24 family envelope stress response protein [Acidaminococcaceae bacterium]|nr:Asp23/Gls24 family envelope stress response protein [Acidaminococcaceae bacterium]
MIGGKTIISEEVFADLVKTAMSKVENVAVSIGDGSSFAAIAKKVAERVVPQVNVKKTDAITSESDQSTVGHVSFEVKVTVVYGANIPETIIKLREMIVHEVETITGYQVDKVDVLVEKLLKSDEVDVDKAEA